MARRHRVSGPQKVFGHAPGTTFARDIPDEQEARLYACGALAAADAEPPQDGPPDDVIETSPGWFELPDGTKVHGRRALDEALAAEPEGNPDNATDADAPADHEKEHDHGS